MGRWSCLSASGTIAASGDEALSAGWVGAIHLDVNAKPLGFSPTSPVENLKPGKAKGCATIGFSQFPTAKTKAQVKKTVVRGGGW